MPFWYVLAAFLETEIPYNQLIIRDLKHSVGVAGLPAVNLKGVGAQEHPIPGYRLFILFVFKA